jgi:hypothetical protein
MRRSILWGMPIALTLASSLQAQDLTELNNLKAEIWEAEVAQRNFAAGLPHCGELNGTNFYFYPRDRVLLGNIAIEVRNGLSKKPSDEPSGHPILRISAVRPLSVHLQDIRYYPEEDKQSGP